MKTGNSSRLPLSSILGLLAVLGLAATTSAKQDFGPKGFPDDWSHQRLIFSAPETFDQLMSGTGAAQERWARFYAIQNDPRYLMQLRKKESEQAALAERSGLSGAVAANWIAAQAADVKRYGPDSGGKKPKKGPPPVEGEEIPRDWSNVMGGASGAGASRLYPAKFRFDTAGKDCATDFVVYTTASLSAVGVANTFANRTGTFTAQPTAAQTATVGNPDHATSIILVATATGGSNTGLNFSIGSDNTAGQLAVTATNLANAINRNGGAVGVTASSSGAVVTVTAITWGSDQNSITLAEVLGGFTWVANTLANGAGTPAQPTIFALNQLYKTDCASNTLPRPATYWSYNTTGTIGSPTAATADTSPVLSYNDNGAQVAFVQRSGTTAYLVLLKWSSSSPGTVGVPAVAPTDETTANYRGCTAPCMTRISLGANSTNSSPFVDYVGNGTLYVGDDAGKLHKFNNVFAGQPGEETTNWPVTVTSGNILSSPVYDPGQQLIFVGSNCLTTPFTNCNRLHSVAPSGTGTVVHSALLGDIGSTGANANGVRDAPLVDSSQNRVFVFMGAAANTANSGTDVNGVSCTNNACVAVYGFATNSAISGQNSGFGTKVYLGPSDDQGDLQRAISAGAFNDDYYSNGGDGFMYVCGTKSDTARRPTLWRITMTDGNLGARTEGPQINNANALDACSPVTLFKNSTNEYLFVSVANGSVGGAGCTAGCIYNYLLTGATWNSSLAVTAALVARGGTGGIIVDNVAGGGGSQIYYATRTSPGIAVQAGQINLQ